MKPDLNPETPIQSETYFPATPRTPRHWSVPAEDGLKLVVALPGCSRDQIQIEVAERRLTIRAKRVSPLPPSPGLRLLHRESLEGDYLLQLKLPEGVDSEAIRASNEAGLLTLCLPALAPHTRSIPIN